MKFLTSSKKRIHEPFLSEHFDLLDPVLGGLMYILEN